MGNLRYTILGRTKYDVTDGLGVRCMKLPCTLLRARANWAGQPAERMCCSHFPTQAFAAFQKKKKKKEQSLKLTACFWGLRGVIRAKKNQNSF